MKHEAIDARSLEAHVLVASRIERDPSLRRIALENLDRWMARPSSSSPYLQTWRDLLNGRLEDLLATMRSPSQSAIALRQSTPFAGTAFISNAERYQLIRKYAAGRS